MRYTLGHQRLTPLLKSLCVENLSHTPIYDAPPYEAWCWVALEEKFPWSRYLDSLNIYMKQNAYLNEIHPRRPLVATIAQKPVCHKIDAIAALIHGTSYIIWHDDQLLDHGTFPY